MNSREKEVIQAGLSDEKHTIKQLERIYEQARKDCEQKIADLNARTDLQNIQSIVYQRQYQEALKKQLDSVIDNLHGNSFTTVSDYLGKCYDNGFYGTLYDLQGQGVPLIFPMRQDQVVKALEIDSKLSKPLYKKMGEDVDTLKKSIRAELSRGVANGSSYMEIATHIANGMNSPFNKAMNRTFLITRTEGHRVQEQAAMDVRFRARDAGADILKQWDATLDDKTREWHADADGQIRELDDFFIVDGEQMEAPGIGGSAHNVCNCRCFCSQRARWALGADETRYLGDVDAMTDEQKENIARKLGIPVDELPQHSKSIVKVNADNYDDFKRKAKDVTVQRFGHPDCDLAKSYGKHYDDVVEKVSNCPNEKAKQVWHKSEQQIKVGDAHYKGQAYCSGGSPTIHVNLETDLKGSSYQTPLQVTFHESGHAIDIIHKGKGSGTPFSFGLSNTYENGKFPTTIKKEVADWVGRVDKEMKTVWKEHKGDWQWLHDHGYISDSWTWEFYKKNGSWVGGEPKYSKSMAYKAIEKEIRKIELHDRSDLSDILEGATKGKIQCGVGHGKSYWSGAFADSNLATEAFTEMFSTAFTNPGSHATIQKYLPESYKVFEEILDVMVK